MNVYLGLDIGTTGIKGMAVDADGRVVQTLSRPLSMITPHPAWAEQNPEDWWQAVLEVLHAVPKNLKVVRIGLSGQMHTLVPLDAEGQVLRNAILWCDQRTALECDEATAALSGETNVIALTGNPIYPGFTLPKILWLRKHEPEIWSRTKTCLIAKDFIAYRLTGELGCDPSDASGSAMYDVVRREWNGSLLQTLGVDAALLPRIQGSAEARGTLRKELAQALRWDEVEVTAGGADNAVSALGVGVCEPGDCMISIGTSGTVVGVTKTTVPDESGKLHFFNHALPDVSYYMGVMLSAAASLNWFKEKMGALLTWDEIEKGIANVPIGAEGMLWLPYLQGERTPHRNPNARGVLYGMSMRSDTMHVFRAVLEGVTYGLRESFELLKEKTTIKQILVVGGGAKNALWCKMLSDNMRVPVVVPEIDEGGAYGAAMLAAMCGGTSLAAVKQWVKKSSVIYPCSNADDYDAVYGQFKSLYRDLSHRWSCDITAPN